MKKKKQNKKQNRGCRRSEDLSKLRNIKRAMKYTQIQLVLKLVLVKNNCIQKSDWQLIVELKMFGKKYI